jgi:hypothetical protein
MHRIIVLMVNRYAAFFWALYLQNIKSIAISNSNRVLSHGDLNETETRDLVVMHFFDSSVESFWVNSMAPLLQISLTHLSTAIGEFDIVR